MFLKEEKESFRAVVKTRRNDYVLQDSDSGCVLEFTSSSNICLYVPSKLPDNYHVTIVQNGEGRVTIITPSKSYRTHGQYSVASIHTQDKLCFVVGDLLNN